MEEIVSGQEAEMSNPRLIIRAVHARLSEELRPACESIDRHARDLKNASVWIERTAFDCFEWDAKAKRSKLKAESDLPNDGKAVLAAFGQAIAAQNAL